MNSNVSLYSYNKPETHRLGTGEPRTGPSRPSFKAGLTKKDPGLV